MSKYDDLLKSLTRLSPKDFAKWVCPEFAKIEKATFEDREFELTYRRVDTLYKVKAKEVGEFLIHLEFQADWEDDLVLRLREYSARIYRELRLPIKTVVVFLTSTPTIRSLESVDRMELNGQLINEFHYTKIILPEQSWETIIASGIAVLLPLIPFTKISKGEEKQALKKAVEAIEKMQDKKMRAELAAALYLLAGYSHSAAIEEVIKEQLMLDLMQSETYRKVTEVGEMLKAREALLKIARRMFGQISPELQRKIEGVRSVKKLDALIDLALACNSMEDFQTKMDELELD